MQGLQPLIVASNVDEPIVFPVRDAYSLLGQCFSFLLVIKRVTTSKIDFQVVKKSLYAAVILD